jgi:hypothetical protein
VSLALPLPRATVRPWWRFLTTMPRPPGGANGRTGPHQPRACGGGVGDAGGRLCDAEAPDAWPRGLVVTRWPTHPDVAVARPE